MASMKKRAREEIDVEEDGPPAKKLSPLEEARARIAAMKAEIAAKEQQKKELLAISGTILPKHSLYRLFFFALLLQQ